MKRLLGDIRRADADFGLIARGERVAVGVSGGKDSLVLLRALAVYSRFDVKPFELVALTLKTGEPFDTAPIAALCGELGVPYFVEECDLLRQLFEVRKEENPCALCARLRRGALLRMAADHGCQKLALGHHREDVEETLLMSVLFEGRLHTFHPLTVMEDQPVAVIRPMVYVPEKDVIHMAKKLAVPVVKNPCPIDGHTTRQEMKELLDALSRRYPRAREYLLNALRDEGRYGLWEKK
ncbi:MAG: tRNA 2-thiocytidine(32) synthetase TtcA [Clostridia bacterium]|nr:tRNA 2-thiocytidine(32) synthetase TtcA [Clostridia bacterium]